VSVSGAGDGLAHELGETAPDAVRVTLTLGGRSFCAAFGAPHRFRPGRVYRARRSERPAACEPHDL
jgi:hypothetical protein